MKSLLITTALLALLAACGKDNKSGTNNSAINPVTTGCYTGVSNCYSTNSYSNYQYGALSVNMILGEARCMDSSQTNQRIKLTQTLSVQTVIPTGDIYAGVTSYGDVAVVVGNGTNQPILEAFICNRSYTQVSQMIQQSSLSIGAYTGCQFKPISALTMRVNNSDTLNFRMLDFGHAVYPSGQLTKFAFCQ